MQDAQLRRLDLGLLLVLSETLRHRRLTLVAARLGQTQSGVSHALGRLRQIFDDPLFLRRPHGLEPTARALALEPTVNAILALARQAVAGAEFDPAVVEGEVRIAAQDYHCGLFAAPLIAKCQAEAPGLKPVFLPLTRRRALDALEAGEVDLVIGFIVRPGDRFVSAPLFEQDYAVTARADHPRLDDLSDLDAYAAERHLLISQNGERTGVVDGVLTQMGRRREVAAALPYALAALATVATTDLIATVPRRLAERFGPTFGLAMVEPPLAIRRFTLSLIRRKRDVGSGRLDWIEAALKAEA
ncbi:LysR family transcriptional regulator [Brevundimonas bacteroides]|uniref:LysR family transcriptional regulator n=1 Tax=Brevundimonas bacteroides TaxID=74311 RepID=UPI00054DC0FB|nr:LysR family transcriptional regulator [Brevundimonas bacteroides]